jgi:hypothetical protein
MGCKLSIIAAAAAGAIGLSALLPAGAAAERFEWTQAVTLETPAGPVTCGTTLPGEPNWAEVIVSASKLDAEVLGAGPLHCEAPSLGAITITPTGLPWRAKLSIKHGRVTVKGTKKIGLEITAAALPSAKCLYEASKLTGSLSTETPPVLTLSALNVKLSKLSFRLCPAGGSFSGSFPLP